MSRPLGDRQIEVLKLISERGFWSVHAGWYWGSNSETLRILGALVRRGLVDHPCRLVELPSATEAV